MAVREVDVKISGVRR